MEDPIYFSDLQTSPLRKPVDEFRGTEGAYLLPHHREEIERLQKQHGFIKSATGGQLTPIHLGTKARVLDCGCADDLGQLQNGNPALLSLHGVDLGSSLFRGHRALDLREHDIRKPFPTSWEWANKFDLVHQCLLVWGIGSDEWTAVIHTLTDAVKPGGYIQLVEAEWVLSSYTEEQPEQKKLAIVQDWSCSSSGMNVHIWKKMTGILDNCGFLDIRETPFDLGYGATAKQPGDRQWTAELLPNSFRHLARKMPKGGIPGVARNADEYMAFLDRLVIEMKAVGYTPKLRWITAKKPPL